MANSDNQIGMSREHMEEYSMAVAMMSSSYGDYVEAFRRRFKVAFSGFRV